MRSDQQYTDKDNQQSPPPQKYELFYFEKIGNRTYLRFTWLAVILILFITIIPFVVVLAIFLYNQSQNSLDQMNVNIHTASSPDVTTNRNIIIPMPTQQLPPAPKVRVRPVPPITIPSATPNEYDRNANEQMTPSQTPKPPT
ncbi:MAG TPA: hypothetical protein VKB86_07870 [Pyrinomonadaceae bacterium]|nr:hypothetical protein [Pyrinomonadaceae bacterium]